ncbi:hypothetical protein SAMN06272781_3264 [Streptomyces sp. 1222.2]|nr:hypothetical protein SAMN06272781_3264 [Streptomyces sp. 1222.2]
MAHLVNGVRRGYGHRAERLFRYRRLRYGTQDLGRPVAAKCRRDLRTRSCHSGLGQLPSGKSRRDRVPGLWVGNRLADEPGLSHPYGLAGELAGTVHAHTQWHHIPDALIVHPGVHGVSGSEGDPMKVPKDGFLDLLAVRRDDRYASDPGSARPRADRGDMNIDRHRRRGGRGCRTLLFPLLLPAGSTHLFPHSVVPGNRPHTWSQVSRLANDFTSPRRHRHVAEAWPARPDGHDSALRPSLVAPRRWWPGLARYSPGACAGNPAVCWFAEFCAPGVPGDLPFR